MNSCIYMGYQAPATSMASVPSITNADLRVAEGYLFLNLVLKGSTQCLEYARFILPLLNHKILELRAIVKVLCFQLSMLRLKATKL